MVRKQLIGIAACCDLCSKLPGAAVYVVPARHETRIMVTIAAWLAAFYVASPGRR
jgi:hypothetical protein